MKVLLCTPIHNALSQRAFHELVERGHAVEVLTATSNTDIEIAVACYQPQLILTVFLRNPLPEHIKDRIPTLNVRTEGSVSRGPSSLEGFIDEDWEKLRIDLTHTWVNTAAESKLIYRDKFKSVGNRNCHRHHIAQAAVHEILETIEGMETKLVLPEWLADALSTDSKKLKGRLHQMMN